MVATVQEYQHYKVADSIQVSSQHSLVILDRFQTKIKTYEEHLSKSTSYYGCL